MKKSLALLLLVPMMLMGLVAFAVAAPSAGAAEFQRLGQLFGVNPDGPALPVHQQRIAVEHATGQVFVANAVTDQIDVYPPKFSSVEKVTSFGAAELSDPFGIAIDQVTGAVYVSDATDNRIVRYTVAPGNPPAYTLDSSFTGPAQGSGAGEVGSFAAALAIDQSAHKLLVADPGNNRVTRFTLDGAYDNFSFDGSAGSGSPGAFTGLLDLAVDSTGDVVVVDSTGDIASSVGDSRVLRYSATGDYEDPIGASLLRPATVAIRPFNDEVFVSWNQDAVNRNEVPQVDMFTDTGAPLGTAPLPPDNSPFGVAYAVVTGMAFDDGPYGLLSVATDASRASSYYGMYGMVGVQLLNPPSPPLIGDEAVTDVRPSQVVLNATLYTSVADTTYHFEYGVVGEGYTKRTPDVVLPRVSYLNNLVVKVRDLAPHTTYQYRLVADNAVGDAVSNGGTFTTALPQPVPTLGGVTDVTLDGATVNAQIDTRGLAGSYSFSVARVDGPEHQSTPLATLPAAVGPAPVSARVNGLLPGLTYAVRLYAHTDGGTTFADTITFATPAAPPFLPSPPPPPAVPGSVYGCSAPHLDAVNGTVRPGQQITLTGTDLGVAGTVAIGSVRAVTRAYSATSIGVTVPEEADGTLPLTLDCGQRSNTIALAIALATNAFTSTVAVKGTIATVTVKVPGAGIVTAGGSRLVSVSKATGAAGAITLRVTLSASGKAALKKARSKRLKATIRLRYTPTGGTAKTATRTVTFKRGAA